MDDTRHLLDPGERASFNEQIVFLQHTHITIAAFKAASESIKGGGKSNAMLNRGLDEICCWSSESLLK